jgi:hypothetical protein
MSISLWEVLLTKDLGHPDTCKYNVVAETEVQAIRKAKREAQRNSGWAARCYRVKSLVRSETRVI